ncbi:MAG: hypothetical protein KBE07_13405, partial [Rhodoferax sp.]|nr:hypothetical protein [Rhodoferax sp.]
TPGTTDKAAQFNDCAAFFFLPMKRLLLSCGSVQISVPRSNDLGGTFGGMDLENGGTRFAGCISGTHFQGNPPKLSPNAGDQQW